MTETLGRCEDISGMLRKGGLADSLTGWSSLRIEMFMLSSKLKGTPTEGPSMTKHYFAIRTRVAELTVAAPGLGGGSQGTFLTAE